MTIDDLALASGFSAKDVAKLRPMLERMVALALAENAAVLSNLCSLLSLAREHVESDTESDGVHESEASISAKSLLPKIDAILSEKDIAKPDADGWVPWAGGECPIPDAKAGEYLLKMSGEMPALLLDSCSRFDANTWHWGDQDITAYRLIKR